MVVQTRAYIIYNIDVAIYLIIKMIITGYTELKIKHISSYTDDLSKESRNKTLLKENCIYIEVKRA